MRATDPTDGFSGMDEQLSRLAHGEWRMEMAAVRAAPTAPTILPADVVELCVGLETCDCPDQPQAGPRSGPRTLKILQSIIIPIELDGVSRNGRRHEVPAQTEQRRGDGTADCHGEER